MSYPLYSVCNGRDYRVMERVPRGYEDRTDVLIRSTHSTRALAERSLTKFRNQPNRYALWIEHYTREAGWRDDHGTGKRY